MTSATKRFAKAALVGAALTGSALMSSANAGTPDKDVFAFTYRTADLRTEAGQAALLKRLDREARRHCRMPGPEDAVARGFERACRHDIKKHCEAELARLAAAYGQMASKEGDTQ